jgi:hypothetical protein
MSDVVVTRTLSETVAWQAREIERLRAHVKAANAVTEEHYAEIERLRQLLRDAGVPEWVINNER